MHYEQLINLRDKINLLNKKYGEADTAPTKNNIYKQIVASKELLEKLIEDTIEEEKINKN